MCKCISFNFFLNQLHSFLFVTVFFYDLPNLLCPNNNVIVGSITELSALLQFFLLFEIITFEFLGCWFITFTVWLEFFLVECICPPEFVLWYFIPLLLILELLHTFSPLFYGTFLKVLGYDFRPTFLNHLSWEYLWRAYHCFYKNLGFFFLGISLYLFLWIVFWFDFHHSNFLTFSCLLH